jgi:2-dehydropantoate 2-reductase
MSLSPSILIVGTGALACLFAARLSAVGIQVTMLGTWPEGIAAIESKGVTLLEADGNQHSYPVQVVTDPKKCVDMKLALVLVKSWQTERVGRQLKECLHPRSQTLTLQNGLGNRQKLAQYLGTARVFQGITTIGGTLLRPGLVRPGGEGLLSIEAIPQLEVFIKIFRRANLEVEKTAEIESLIWGKLAVNAAINPLTAILGVPNGVLLAYQQLRQLMALASEEVAAVAAAQGIQLPYDEIPAAVEDVARRTARNHSSMLQDVQRGAPTEIEAINGAVLRVAEQTSVPTPVNQTLYLLVKSMVGMSVL